MNEQVKTVVLAPIRETKEDFDEAERRLKELFKREIYYPLLRELAVPRAALANALEDLVSAIGSGRITFDRGRFSGKFSASLSRELRNLGATWDRKSSSWNIPLRSLPHDLKYAISASEFRFRKKLDAIDSRLRQLLPEDIAGRVKLKDCFDRALWKVDKDFRKNVKGLAIPPDLTKEQRGRIADEWQDNMKLWVKDFTEKEIGNLRKDVQEAAFQGVRREALIGKFQKSYEVSANKAKFLARQETSLLMTKFKQVRYQEIGVNEYIWTCVKGTPKHPVRPAHKVLDGKKFTWDHPPITTAPGEPQRRNNPGQDYNCRCVARPIVRFKKREGSE